ncbi:MAG TPA: hypothetical protein VFW07_12315 [Parafilimonas sp.]|nr:hypothetical protein [Parafilimonas sp.]
MKKIVLAIILCTGFLPYTLFAGSDNVRAHISNTLSLLLEMSRKKNINADQYVRSTFLYNGMRVTAVKSKTSDWIGYFKKLSANDLPETAIKQINAKYKTGKIEKVIMYFNNAGDVNYFAKIIVNHKCIILRVQESGYTKVF